MSEADENCDAIQGALQRVMRERGELPDDAVLTGWVVAYEYRTGDDAFAGKIHGPQTMTAWNGMGLLEWARLCFNDGFAADDEEE